jgi:uncharacterized alkaline shock family protein YloU
MPLKSRYNAHFTGDVTYGSKVVPSVIELAVTEINGIAALHGRGVRIERSGGLINIDVFVDVYNGVSCTDVAFRVQENIKRSIESMTECKVGVINVNVLGLEFRDNADKQSYKLYKFFGQIDFFIKNEGIQ